MCIESVADDDAMDEPIGLAPCHGQGGAQTWLLSQYGEIRKDGACIDFDRVGVFLYPCHGARGNQMWIFHQEENMVQHALSELCLEIREDVDELDVDECDQENTRQLWDLHNFDALVLKKDEL